MTRFSVPGTGSAFQQAAVACATRSTLAKVKPSAMMARQPSVPNLMSVMVGRSSAWPLTAAVLAELPQFAQRHHDERAFGHEAGSLLEFTGQEETRDRRGPLPGVMLPAHARLREAKMHLLEFQSQHVAIDFALRQQIMFALFE